MVAASDQLLRDNFNLVDTDGDGYLSRDEVLLLFRGLGQTPSDTRILLALTKVSEKTDFEAFKTFYALRYREPVTQEQLVDAFALFDPFNTGMIPALKFRELVTSIGDSLTHAEVDEVLKIAGYTGNVDIPYAEFARSLALGPSN